ncbi:hypothetical protein BC835DRAFT_1530922 [Cytidiella melzeri]|nr:hypothetical protein BC835DRAFT_1530922 [Cytidiella melzeri]
MIQPELNEMSLRSRESRLEKMFWAEEALPMARGPAGTHVYCEFIADVSRTLGKECGPERNGSLRRFPRSRGEKRDKPLLVAPRKANPHGLVQSLGIRLNKSVNRKGRVEVPGWALEHSTTQMKTKDGQRVALDDDFITVCSIKSGRLVLGTQTFEHSRPELRRPEDETKIATDEQWRTYTRGTAKATCRAKDQLSHIQTSDVRCSTNRPYRHKHARCCHKTTVERVSRNGRETVFQRMLPSLSISHLAHPCRSIHSGVSDGRTYGEESSAFVKHSN